MLISANPWERWKGSYDATAAAVSCNQAPPAGSVGKRLTVIDELEERDRDWAN